MKKVEAKDYQILMLVVEQINCILYNKYCWKYNFKKINKKLCN